MTRIAVPSLDVRTQQALQVGLSRWAAGVAAQINNVSEGRVIGAHNAVTAVPATGSYAVGDFVRNSTPSELGAAASKYVILGWICTVAGSPGTLLECRALTGN